MARKSLIAIFLLLSINLFAQDGRYWNEAFGTRSLILNGIVVGSAEDLGAVYYNPAFLSEFDKTAFVLSGNVFQLNNITIENGLGDGLSLKNSSFGKGPRLLAGTFKLGFLKGHQFAYSFLTKSQFDNNFVFSVNEFGNFVKAFPGEEYFSGEISSESRKKEEWIGLSWAYPLSEKLSIGISGFYSNLERKAGVKLQLQAYLPDSSWTGMYIDQRAYGFKSASLLSKIALSWKADKYSFGLTVTTPKIEVSGSGNTVLESFLSGLDTSGNGINDDVYIIDHQNDLDATHKSPFSIAFGVGIKPGTRSQVNLTAEWFSATSSYVIMKSAPSIGQSTGEEFQMIVVDDLKSVFNFGVGLEIYLNDDILLMGSFATDFSAVKPDVKEISELDLTVNNNSFLADVYHFGFGTNIKVKNALLTLGVNYSNTNESIKRAFTVADADDPVTTDARIIISRWLFLVGFSFDLK